MALHSPQNAGNSVWLDSFVFFVLVFSFQAELLL